MPIEVCHLGQQVVDVGANLTFWDGEGLEVLVREQARDQTPHCGARRLSRELTHEQLEEEADRDLG